MLIKNKNDSSSFLNVNDDSSILASGPNSISSPPTSYRFGGVFKFNPLITTCVPSTLATPISTLTLDLPIKNISTLTAITGIIASLI